MEEREEESDKKAERLIKEFKKCFNQIGYTQHKLGFHEAKGKGSNVNWCARHL